ANFAGEWRGDARGAEQGPPRISEAGVHGEELGTAKVDDDLILHPDSIRPFLRTARNGQSRGRCASITLAGQAHRDQGSPPQLLTMKSISADRAGTRRRPSAAVLRQPPLQGDEHALTKTRFLEVARSGRRELRRGHLDNRRRGASARQTR